MLSLYLKSIIIYAMIFFAMNKIGAYIIKNRTDIDYKEYIKNKPKGKINEYLICLVPILRLFYLVVMFVVIFGSKEILDKIFSKDKGE